MNIYRLALIIVLLGFSFFQAVTLRAQTPAPADQLPPVSNPQNYIEGQDILPDVRPRQKTHPEIILLSQYKLAETQPDIDALIKQSPLVKKAQEIDKAAIALTEFNRISNSYNLRDPQQEIVVHTHLQVDEYSSMQNAVIFDELDNKTFFRFNIYGEHVGIVPSDIADFSRIRLSPDRAATMFKELGGGKHALAEFILVPDYADRTEPLEIGGKSYWLMSAKIGEMRLWTSVHPASAELLWFYQAPWYRPRNVSELDELYSMK